MKSAANRATSRDNAKRRPLALKVGAAVLALLIVFGSVYFALTSSVFSLRHTDFRGNKFLSDRELMALMGLTGGENMFRLSSRDLAQCLRASPWIRDAKIKKQFPGRMVFLVQEAEPEAILRDGADSYLIDAEGVALEKITGEPAQFLPVIVGAKGLTGKGYREAVALAVVLKHEGVTRDSGRVEIRGFEKGAHEISMTIDGLLVKVGEGNYREKLVSLFELVDQIRKLDITVDFVDLRFQNRVVVKHMAGELQ